LGVIILQLLHVYRNKDYEVWKNEKEKRWCKDRERGKRKGEKEEVYLFFMFDSTSKIC
jgi:hypothetical protein